VNSTIPITILEVKLRQEEDHRGVRQDKQPHERLSAKPQQPATAYPPAVGSKQGSATATAKTAKAVDRQTRHGSETRQTEQVTGRVPRHIKTAILSLAKQNGWTESKVIATACEAYLEHDLGEKFGVRLAAQLTSAMHKTLQNHNNRLAYLSVKGHKASDESRIINTKVLSYLFGSDTELYQQVVRQAKKEVADNLKKRIEEE
jgi:hypothetical protein